MDSSRRTTRGNAFFAGIGKSKRIVLFDNLIRQLTIEEIVSVLAHEIGHYKKKHLAKNIAISVLTTGVMFYILSFFLKNPSLFEAFK